MFTALLVSGFLEVAVDFVMERKEFNRNQRKAARSMAIIMCEKDIVFQYLAVYGAMAHLSNSASFFELPAAPGEIPCELFHYLTIGENNTLHNTKSSLLELAKLKILLSTIHSLERLDKKLRGDDELIIALTRMVARCIKSWRDDANFLDISMLKLGAISGSSLDFWHKTVIQPCRIEYGKGGITTRLLTPKLVETKLFKPLSLEDVKLCRWLLGVKSGVFVTIAAFIKGGSWKRAPEAAKMCESWKVFRRLLFVGVQGSTGVFGSKEEWMKETDKMVKLLQHTPVENRDGTTSRMPTIASINSLNEDMPEVAIDLMHYCD